MKPDAILVGDLHIREDTPTCRTDNFWETQVLKFRWLKKLWYDNGQPLVLQAGDVFQKWKSTPSVLSLVFNELPPMVTIPGNHDLPSHNLKEYKRSSLYSVESSGLGWTIMEVPQSMLINNWKIVGLPWEDSESSEVEECTYGDILLAHRMVLKEPTSLQLRIMGGSSSKNYLKDNPKFQLIVTGHNHQPFSIANKGQRLVNPGSFTRQTASEIHDPRVYLWYKKDNRLKAEYVPHKLEHLSRDHLDSERERDERLEAFVETLQNVEMDDSVNFRYNMMKYLKSNRVNPSVHSRILEAMEGKGANK